MRSKRELTLKEAAYLKLSILDGDPLPSYRQMLHSWVAGAWPLLEWVARRHIQTDPADVRARLLLADALQRQGRSDEADLAVEEAYVSCQNPEEFEYETSIVFAMDGRLKEAEQHFRRCLLLMELKDPDKRPVSDKGKAFRDFLEENRLPIAVTFREAL